MKEETGAAAVLEFLQLAIDVLGRRPKAQLSRLPPLRFMLLSQLHRNPILSDQLVRNMDHGNLETM